MGRYAKARLSRHDRRLRDRHHMPFRNGRRPFLRADRHLKGTRLRLRAPHHHSFTRKRRRGLRAKREGQPVRFDGEVREAAQKSPAAFSEKAWVSEVRHTQRRAGVAVAVVNPRDRHLRVLVKRHRADRHVDCSLAYFLEVAKVPRQFVNWRHFHLLFRRYRDTLLYEL